MQLLNCLGLFYLIVPWPLLIELGIVTEKFKISLIFMLWNELMVPN